ncbi:O-antigen ligase [Actinomadura sp. WMMB 499]|uniref:O-antigen ligase family protein n=1 Tax=Actinomadura sp. WMMB 499 TaxID=1219491 RepID=UPI0012452523|nr:O-antigen ligase family protein [Actinomadura sp. WMMB 499]QFG24129.1 O-antigen ligase family protein [Actinomadura sp. WMMB 499]
MTTITDRPPVRAAPDGAPGGQGRAPLRNRWRPEAVLLSLGIASLPMLMPAGLPPGPGNTGLPDLVLVVLTVATLLWAGKRKVPVRWPFLLPTLLTIIAGGIAAYVNQAGLLTLAKDLFVLFWGVCVANLCRDPRLLRVAVRSFVGFGTLYAVVLIAGFVLGIDAMSGKQPDGMRAMFTFGDANYASNWFICVFFIVRATRTPHAPWKRYAVLGILLVAELLTGSNGGLLSLLVALVLGHLFRLFREGRTYRAVATACLAGVVAGGGVLAVTTVDVQPYLDRISAIHPVLRDSIGRTTDSSTATRSTVFTTTGEMIAEQPHPWGIGPGETVNAMMDRQETYVREAHNDYIASTLERGFLGGVALIVLVFALLLTCTRIARRGALTGEYARIVPRPEMFGALVAVFLISGMFYETLHYRHGWAIFGLIAALHLFGRRGAADRPLTEAEAGGGR